MARLGAFARFFKADLQMQTPAERHNWRGTSLAVGASVEDRTAAAEAYIQRCYATGLEMIAITDHNICPPDCESLIPELHDRLPRGCLVFDDFDREHAGAGVQRDVCVLFGRKGSTAWHRTSRPRSGSTRLRPKQLTVPGSPEQRSAPGVAVVVRRLPEVP
jgi:hypothetical protein